jgi:hypothetical protein
MGNKKKIKTLGYLITDDTKVINDLFGFNEEAQGDFLKIYDKVKKNKSGAIKELSVLIQKYPHLPQFMNLLTVLYSKQGNSSKSYELNRQLVEVYPDYLYGKINLANEYINKNQFEKVPGILGESMEIKVLYPNRKEFHVNEVVTFCKTAILYFTGIEDVESAELRLDILIELNKKFELDISDEISEFARTLLAIKFKQGQKHLLKQREKAREVKVVPVKVVEPTDEKPRFIHEIVEQLYCNSMRIDHGLLRQILLLPRETLISDLHKVIYDSIARFGYFFNETEWQPETHEFLNHAIILLTELKSEESLNVIFDVLRQDEEYLDYWFSDDLAGLIWEALYVFGFNHLDQFKSFLFEPNHYCFARAVISDAVSQIALHHPERKNEIIIWYQNLIKEILANKDNEKIIDTDWVGFIVWDLLDINAVELLPIISELYVNNLASEDICGNYNEIVKEFKAGRNIESGKRKTFGTIFSKYDHILSSWSYYNEEDELEEDELEEDDFYDYDKASGYPERIKEMMPIVNPNKDIGRNDPCPCGSGKKYKKCCMNND